MRKIASRIGLLLGALLIAGCDKAGPGSANTPQEMFQGVIKDPVPSSVTNLQGVGDTWQGYSLYLRFTASDEDIDTIVEQGFKPVAWKDIADRFTLPSGYDRFVPRWDPSGVSNKECYELPEVQNGWTDFGAHWLVIDRSSGTVYFRGLGP
jgi:hypothetical protein